jgi:NDP-sugar pyrophosphorylase family protein/fructose/tagatose bisphosphate aldolase
MKFFIGVMSKNIVDTVIKFANKKNDDITFIPSRRQVDYNCGYVNNWITADFVSYVKERNQNIKIERDHSGCSQGTYEDDGYSSLEIDCKYMDIIHIDPFKKYQNFNEGLEETIKMIEFCHNLNKNIEFEIGTEEAIRKFEVDELELLITELKNRLSLSAFNQIKYLVIQAGTALNEKSNIGIFDEKKLINMIAVAKKYNLISKEHNGDWTNNDIILKKAMCGLECINIAPEFGEIETSIYLKYFKKYGLFDKFYNICLNSKKWEKWVSSSFVPEENKEKLVLICGHYTFSYPEFLELKNQLSIPIDDLISDAIMTKLNDLYGIFRNKVLITTSGIGSRLENITKYLNKSLVRVGNKFAISYIIDKFDYKTTDFIITLGYHGELVKEFLKIAYENHNFIFVNVDNYNGEGSSLVYSLLQAEKYLQSPFLLFCCDSIVIDNISFSNFNNQNYLFVAKSDNSSLYSSVNISGNKIIKANKKGEKNYDYVYTGISYIYNYKNYWIEMNNLYKNNSLNRDLSDIDNIDILILKNHIFYYNILEEWYDTGNIKSYNIALNKIKCDYDILHKDTEAICFINNKVIKFINNKEYNLNKIKRGLLLYPNVPKIINKGNYFFSMEFIEGTILSKIKNYGEIYKLLNWAYKNLWINKEVNEDFKNICHKFYKLKTYDRLNELKKFNFYDYEIINGVNVGKIEDLLLKLDWNYLNTNEFYQYHGDFILDNIIYYNNSYKLIDWRQDFGGNINCGDMYYDLAKLRHNIIFNHDNINNGLFEIIINNNDEINIDLKCNYLLIKQLEDFDKFILEKNLNLKKIKILTSIIWLNMSPLHDQHISKFLFYFGKLNLSLIIN